MWRGSSGLTKRLEQYRAIDESIQAPFEISTKSDLAGHALNVWHDTKDQLRLNFDVEADIDPKVHERLKKLSKLYQSRPVQVTDELIRWANRDG